MLQKWCLKLEKYFLTIKMWKNTSKLPPNERVNHQISSEWSCARFFEKYFFSFFSKISFFIFCIFIIYMGSKWRSSWKWWHPRLQTGLKIFLSALETCYNNWGCSRRSGEHSALWIVVIQRLEKKRPTKNCRYS